MQWAAVVWWWIVGAVKGRGWVTCRVDAGTVATVPLVSPATIGDTIAARPELAGTRDNTESARKERCRTKGD
jgi:hypothetical protein